MKIKSKNISLNSPKGVTVIEMYNYLKYIWGKEELRKTRKEKLNKINEKGK